MEIKHKNVNIGALDIRMRPALIACEEVYKSYGIPFVITSACDGIHSAGSYHYYGLAIDVRINNIPPSKLHSLVADLKAKLPSPFDVILETNHIHIEYDLSKHV